MIIRHRPRGEAQAQAKQFEIEKQDWAPCWPRMEINLPMYKYTVAPINVSLLTLVQVGTLPIMLPVVQPVLDKGVAFGKPLDKVFIVNVMDRNVHVLVASDER